MKLLRALSNIASCWLLKKPFKFLMIIMFTVFVQYYIYNSTPALNVGNGAGAFQNISGENLNRSGFSHQKDPKEYDFSIIV